MRPLGSGGVTNASFGATHLDALTYELQTCKGAGGPQIAERFVQEHSARTWVKEVDDERISN
jgi:hypothetical protein